MVITSKTLVITMTLIHHPFNKVVTRFVDVTILPFWIFFIFPLDTQASAIKIQRQSKVREATLLVRHLKCDLMFIVKKHFNSLRVN